MHVYCDFDGTISTHDATDYVLSRLADPSWEEIEAQWAAGEIDSGACMRQQIALIDARRDELDAVLDEIEIDPGFIAFVAFCQSENLAVTIVSDGVDYFIRRILSRIGLDSLPVIANRFVVTEHVGRDSYALLSPYADSGCRAASGVCKCRVLDVAVPRVYVGDGRSDFCVSDRPELIFAKKALADHCRNQNIPFIAYDGFHDVTRSLRGLLPALREEEFPQRFAAA
ncbi:MtnX-like HAD-IB family phosphatase [Ochrobactrum sp. GPK 3]|uniref:MtnX-like HAD-IB family phosphatase n=1 Tax=Brucella sp. 22210 TaxID=3453892 RepID=UPI0031385DB9